MASKVMRVIITGDVKGAVRSFAELDIAAGKTEMTVGQRFQSLGKYVGVAMAAGVVAAGVGLFKLGESFDEVYDKIRTSTGATGKSLEGLKDDFRAVVATVPTDFNSAGNAITILNQKLGLTGKPLQDLAGQFLNVSRITKTDLTENLKAGTDMLNSFGIEAQDQPAILDQMYRAAQLSGLSFTDMLTRTRDAGIQLRALGLDATQAAALVATLGKAGIDTSEVLPGITRALAESAQAGVPANEFFGNFIDQIKNAPDATAAMGVAVDVLGSKSGPKFAQLVREGKLSYDEMLASIVNGKDTISGASSETEDFSEKWQRFKNQALLALEPVATRVFNVVGKGMDYLSKHKPMLIAVAAVIGTVLVTAFAAWAISAASAAVATIAATWPILAIIAAVALVVAAVILFATKWDEIWAKIKEVVSGIWNKIKEVFNSAVQWLSELPGKIWDAIVGISTWVKDNILKYHPAVILYNLAVEWVPKIVSWLTELPGKIWDAIVGISTWVKDNIIANHPLVWLFNAAVDWAPKIVQFFSELPGKIWDALGDLGSWLWEHLKTGFQIWKDNIAGVVDEVVGFITGLPGRLGDIGSAIADAISGGFKGAWNSVANWINDVIPNSIGFHIPWPVDKDVSIDLPDNPIPRLAKGGIVTAPTLALIGEAGPEAVVPLSKANNPFMGGDMSITIPITLDGRVVTEVVVSNLNRAGGPKILQRAVI